MSRPKKQYKNFSIRMDENIYNNLVEYADKKGQTLTKAVELILKEKFELESKEQDDLNLSHVF